jgi:probable HAF family extracellular repeat protein
MCRWRYFIVLAVVLVFHVPAQAVTFQSISMLPDAEMSMPSKISGDGTVVIGKSGPTAFRWTQGKGMQALEPLSGLWLEEVGQPEHGCSNALGISHDGSVILGSSSSCDRHESHICVFWTDSEVIPLGDFSRYGEGVALSGDGSTAIVRDDYGPGSISWHLHNVSTGRDTPFYRNSICFLDSPDVECWESDPHPTALSENGSTVVGIDFDNGPWAFFWTEEEGMTYLHSFEEFHAAPMILSEAHGVSADGSTIVGALNGRAFRWTRPGGFETIGGPASFAFDVSSDGTVVVGEYYGADGAGKAFFWTEGTGLTDLKEHLEGNGLDLAGWTLESARSVSGDGTVITGWGINPDGRIEGWVVDISVAEDGQGDGAAQEPPQSRPEDGTPEGGESAPDAGQGSDTAGTDRQDRADVSGNGCTLGHSSPGVELLLLLAGALILPLLRAPVVG